jgi:hypothetical protein
MNLEESHGAKDRKEVLREKRELKMLERFQYEPREKSLRESTRKIKSFDNFYSDGIKIRKVSDMEELPQRKGKKRGRKPKVKDNYNASAGDEEKKGRKKQAVEGKSISRPVKVVKMGYEEVEMTSQVENFEQKVSEDNLDYSENDKSYLSIEESVDCSLLRNPSESNASKTQSKNIISLTLSSDGNLNSGIASQKNGFSNGQSSSKEDSNTNNENILPPEYVNESEQIRERVVREYPREVERFKMHKKQKNLEPQNTLDGFSNDHNEYGVNLKSDTFINCDLRFFNFDMLTSRIGYFDVVMIDPPWRIKGGQRNDSSFMFSNSKFNLEYNTLSNNEIVSLPVEKLSKKGKIKYI